MSTLHRRVPQIILVSFIALCVVAILDTAFFGWGEGNIYTFIPHFLILAISRCSTFSISVTVSSIISIVSYFFAWLSLIVSAIFLYKGNKFFCITGYMLLIVEDFWWGSGMIFNKVINFNIVFNILLLVLFSLLIPGTANRDKKASAKKRSDRKQKAIVSLKVFVGVGCFARQVAFPLLHIVADSHSYVLSNEEKTRNFKLYIIALVLTIAVTVILLLRVWLNSSERRTDQLVTQGDSSSS